MKNTLIVFEGCDGTGKSSLAAALTTHLLESGKKAQLLSFPGREAGTLGELVYALHHGEYAAQIPSIDPVAMQCLHVAAHFDVISRKIHPALQRGETVVLDRFWWSTRVYGIAFGVEQRILDHLLQAESEVWGSVLPATLFLVERSTPLRDEPMEIWTKCKVGYDELVVQEQARYPVHRVSNESTQQDALEQIVAIVSQTL